MKETIELWVAFEKGWKSKDESAVKSIHDEVWFYDHKPVKDEYGYSADDIGGIDARFFPSITEANSPKKVRITIEDIDCNGFIGEDVTDEITSMSPISHEPLATLKKD